MPVTATLLRRISEVFGEDATNEMITWFDHWQAGFKADIESFVERRFEVFEARFDTRLGQVKAELRLEIAGLRNDMAAQRSELIRWMFVFWVGTVVPLAGLMVALIKL